MSQLSNGSELIWIFVFLAVLFGIIFWIGLTNFEDEPAIANEKKSSVANGDTKQ